MRSPAIRTRPFSLDSPDLAVDQDRESFQATLRLGTLDGRIRPVKRPDAPPLGADQFHPLDLRRSPHIQGEQALLGLHVSSKRNRPPGMTGGRLTPWPHSASSRARWQASKSATGRNLSARTPATHWRVDSCRHHGSRLGRPCPGWRDVSDPAPCFPTPARRPRSPPRIPGPP
jgi:hypothetical protein